MLFQNHDCILRLIFIILLHFSSYACTLPLLFEILYDNKPVELRYLFPVKKMSSRPYNYLIQYFVWINAVFVRNYWTPCKSWKHISIIKTLKMIIFRNFTCRDGDKKKLLSKVFIQIYLKVSLSYNHCNILNQLSAEVVISDIASSIWFIS